VLRDRATRLEQAHAKLAPLVTEAVLAEVTADVPAEWYGEQGVDASLGGRGGSSPRNGRAYVEHLLRRAPLVLEVIRP
jgi:hypothetical protein